MTGCEMIVECGYEVTYTYRLVSADVNGRYMPVMCTGDGRWCRLAYDDKDKRLNMTLDRCREVIGGIRNSNGIKIQKLPVIKYV